MVKPCLLKKQLVWINAKYVEVVENILLSKMVKPLLVNTLEGLIGLIKES